MDSEQVWAALPVRLKNLALRIAREYNHGWAHSSAVPAEGEYWEWPEEVPSLDQIKAGTPEGPRGRGIAGPCVSGADGFLYITHGSATGRLLIIVRYSEQEGERYTVRIARPNGRNAQGTYCVDQQQYVGSAEATAWGPRHFAAWHRAWGVLGLSPAFPELAREWHFDLTEQGIPNDGRLEFATVHLRAGARPRAEDLYDCLRIADAVYVHGANGGVARIVAQD
jgi:hypothetical protein